MGVLPKLFALSSIYCIAGSLLNVNICIAQIILMFMCYLTCSGHINVHVLSYLQWSYSVDKEEIPIVIQCTVDKEPGITSIPLFSFRENHLRWSAVNI